MIPTVWALVFSSILSLAQTPGTPPPPGNEQAAKPRPDPDFDTKVARPAHTGQKGPRVVFDQAHHNMLTAEDGYKPLARLVRSDGCVIGVNRHKFDTPDLFKTCEVLVIGVALGAKGLRKVGAEKSAFTDAECDAVRDFVKDGGALLLVTDGFPAGHAAQRLADRFDVKMSKGSTIRDPVFWRELGTLCDHPITRGRDKSEIVESVRTFTGQVMEGPKGCSVLMKFPAGVQEQCRDEADLYKALPKTRDVGGTAMSIAFEFGKGRVVILGEAAMLSADIFSGEEKRGMNDTQHGNRQFALNLMRWLTRKL